MARAQGKDGENTENLVLTGAWQPCLEFRVHLATLCFESTVFRQITE